MLPLILASASPRRKVLFRQMGFDPAIKPADLPEVIPDGTPPTEAAEMLAAQKSAHIAQSSEGLIVAADTIVVLDGKILGKPVDESEAADFLRKLSDNTHEVITGVSIRYQTEKSTKQTQFSVHTKVTFSELSDQEIRSYIATGSPMDKAGAYGIQDDWGSVFVSRIDGCYYNVVGFPVNAFYQRLKSFAPEFLPVAVIS